MIYLQNKKVGASLCGTDAKLSKLGALNLIQDSLTELTGELHIDGLTAINKYGAILVYVKNHIKFLRTASWNEKIKVESFVSTKSMVRFTIDTCIKNSKEEILVYSRIELCGIDIQTNRIRKIETVGVDDTVAVHTPLMEIEFNKKEQMELDLIESTKVKSSNIDYVHHTNNIEYIRFIFNTLTVSQIENNPITEMEINYINQSYEGDILDIYSKRIHNKVYYEIKNKDQSVLKCDFALN